jgi:AcrR family transcriptional regulator
MTRKGSSRQYRKTKRARQEQETRRRITEAAVELHRAVGPARTAITDIAKHAGVSRMTVYSHFPTEVDLLMACSTHWARSNQFPDPSSWAPIDDPAERLTIALEELYRWYGRKQDMLGKVLRDIHTVEALATVMDGLWSPWLRAIIQTLAVGWPAHRAGGDELMGALRLAVDFDTWRLLTGSGLDDRAAADLVARMLRAEFGPDRKPDGR